MVGQPVLLAAVVVVVASPAPVGPRPWSPPVGRRRAVGLPVLLAAVVVVVVSVLQVLLRLVVEPQAVPVCFRPVWPLPVLPPVQRPAFVVVVYSPPLAVSAVGVLFLVLVVVVLLLLSVVVVVVLHLLLVVAADLLQPV